MYISGGEISSPLPCAVESPSVSTTTSPAQQAYLQAAIARIQAQANRFADTAALFQALGGGWWNRTDIGPQASRPLIPIQ